MEIKSDVNLKGDEWLKALKLLAPFFTQSSQPNYSIYAISMSIGIMYDKQSDVAGKKRMNVKKIPSLFREPYCINIIST